MEVRRLTRGVLENTPRPAKGRIKIRDRDMPRLTVRISSNGRIGFYVYYRSNGRQREPKIGEWPTMSIERAREVARDTVADAQAGIDLSARRKAARAAPTVAKFMDEYLNDYVKPHNAESHAYNVELNIENHIKPHIGKLPVTEVTKRDVDRLLAKIAAKAPVQANRVGSLLSKAFNLAEEWKYRDENTNPAMKFKRQQERKRRSALDADGLKPWPKP